jgi:hypothetical protein
MITTITGRLIDPFNFKADDISIEEIAHAMACSNRFFGHTRFPISIAQHAVSVSYLSPGHELQGLHHDDSEVLLGDINKWLKMSDCFAGYRELEDKVQREFFRKFGCAEEMHPIVKMADKFAVRCELVFGFGGDYRSAHPDYQPPSVSELNRYFELTNFVPMDWREAERLFIRRHNELVKTYELPIPYSGA